MCFVTHVLTLSKAGDVIKSIDGKNVDNIGTAMSQYQELELKAGNSIQVISKEDQ